MFDDQPRPDVRSDVFSLAATLYTLLAGRTPFEIPGRPNGALDLTGRIERGDITPMDRTDVPASLLALLRKGMAVSRTDRFATAVDFARALQRVEMELDYAPTTIDVPNLVVPGMSVDRTTDDDATRARAVRTISAQSAPPAAPPATAPAYVAPVIESSPESTVMRGAAPAETVMRSTATPNSTLAVESVDAPPARRRGVLVAIVVAVVLVVGAGAAVIFGALGGGTANEGGAEAPIAQQPGGDVDLDDVLGVAVEPPGSATSAVLSDGSIEFTWVPAAGATPDAYRWEQISGGDAVSAPDPATTAVLPASTTGALVCIQIWAIEQGAQSVSPLEACAP